MIPADILTVLIALLILVVPAVVLAGLGAKIAAKRARLVEPETYGDDGGRPYRGIHVDESNAGQD